MMSRVINLNKVNTFQKFFDNVWDYIDHLGFYHRVDIVIDNYVDENLLKGQISHSRDLGIIIKFTLTDKLPTNFKKDFLLSGSNKKRFVRYDGRIFCSKQGDLCYYNKVCNYQMTVSPRWCHAHLNTSRGWLQNHQAHHWWGKERYHINNSEVKWHGHPHALDSLFDTNPRNQ